MIQKLSEKGLVSYEKYKGVKFTNSGLKIGRQIKRRHRLLECLLIDVMGFKGDARMKRPVGWSMQWMMN